MQKFEILRREKLLDTPWVTIEKQLVRLPNGENKDWYINIGNDVVIVVPVLENGQILVQEGYKHGSGKTILEFCAGMVDEGESPLEAAKRELLEETGYKAENWIKLGRLYPNPTGSNKRFYFYLARDAKKHLEPQLEPAEQIRTFLVKDYSELETVFFESAERSTMAAFAALTFIRPHLQTSS